MPSPAAPARPRAAAPAGSRARCGAAIVHPFATVRWLWLGVHDAGPSRPRHDRDRAAAGSTPAWLGAFLLKMLGSTWDVSWHFRWLRDDLAPPHLLNSRRHRDRRRPGDLPQLHAATASTSGRCGSCSGASATFLIAVPIDILNHRINGLDITSWSPSHGLLYLGTAIMLAGAIRGWWLYSAPGPHPRTWSRWACGCSSSRTSLFPNQHQEYGVLSLRAYDAGQTTAEPQLLDFAAAQGQSPHDVHAAGAVLGAPRLADLRRPAGAGRGPQDRRAALDGHDHRRRRTWPTAPSCGCSWSAWASRRRCCRWSCSSARCWSTSRSPTGCPAGLAGLLVTGVVYGVAVGAGGPRPAARRGTGGRCCRSRSASPCCGPAVDLLARSALAGPLEGRRRACSRGARARLIRGTPARSGWGRTPDDVASEAGAGAGSPARGARVPRRQAAGADMNRRSRSAGGHTTCWP